MRVLCRTAAHDPFRTSVERRTGHTRRVTRREVVIAQDALCDRCVLIAELRPKPSTWPAYFVFRALIRTLAVGPDDAGFWPVINNPSGTTWTPQFLTLE